MCILTGLESRDLRRAQRAAIAMSGTHGDPHINMAPRALVSGGERRAVKLTNLTTCVRGLVLLGLNASATARVISRR